MGDYSGGYEQDNVELNLVDSMDHHDDVEYSTHVSPGESGEAVRAMMKLPSGTQEQIRNLLLSNEKLQFVEKPSRWRSTSHSTAFLISRLFPPMHSSIIRYRHPTETEKTEY